MNRPIKFRMWNNVKTNPKKSKYFYDADMVMDCLKQQMIFEQNPDNKLGYNHVGDGNSFEQFIGLKDKNRKDVFEGDIVRLTNTAYGSNTGIVKYFMHQNPSFQAEEVNIDFPSTFHLQIKAEDIEVIGNIFENPELKTGF